MAHVVFFGSCKDGGTPVLRTPPSTMEGGQTKTLTQKRSSS